MKRTLQISSFLLLGLVILSSCVKEKTGESPKQIAKKIEVELPKVEKEKVMKEQKVEKPNVIPPIPMDSAPPPIVRRLGYIPEPDPYPISFPEPRISGLPEPMPPRDPNQIYEVVEVEPVFPGGAEAMMKFIKDSMQYPEISEELGHQGRVYLAFIIEKDGSIGNIQLLRSVTPPLDNEAKRIIRSMPNWKPGEQDGYIVRCRKIIPITFSLD